MILYSAGLPFHLACTVAEFKHEHAAEMVQTGYLLSLKAADGRDLVVQAGSITAMIDDPSEAEES